MMHMMSMHQTRWKLGDSKVKKAKYDPQIKTSFDAICEPVKFNDIIQLGDHLGKGQGGQGNQEATGADETEITLDTDMSEPRTEPASPISELRVLEAEMALAFTPGDSFPTSFTSAAARASSSISTGRRQRLPRSPRSDSNESTGCVTDTETSYSDLLETAVTSEGTDSFANLEADHLLDGVGVVVSHGEASLEADAHMLLACLKVHIPEAAARGPDLISAESEPSELAAGDKAGLLKEDLAVLAGLCSEEGSPVAEQNMQQEALLLEQLDSLQSGGQSFDASFFSPLIAELEGTGEALASAADETGFDALLQGGETTSERKRKKLPRKTQDQSTATPTSAKRAKAAPKEPTSKPVYSWLPLAPRRRARSPLALPTPSVQDISVATPTPSA